MLVIFTLGSCKVDNVPVQVFYVAPGGSDVNEGTINAPWATFAHAVAELTPGDTLYVGGGTYSERLVPSVSGTKGNVITIAAFAGETPLIDGTSISEDGWWYGLIHLNNLEYVKIMGFTVTNAKGQGIQANACNNIFTEWNTIDTTVSSVIMAWDNSNITITDNTITGACTVGRGYEECISVANTSVFTISDNIVHDGFMEGIDAKDGVSEGQIYGNKVYNLTRLGIYIDAWDSPSKEIDVYDNTECGYWVGVGGIGATHPVDFVTFDSNISRNNGEDGIRISVR